jgi:ubiE/COQ5 methyltransferase-like protein
MTALRSESAPTRRTHHGASPGPFTAHRSKAHRSKAHRSEAGRYDQRTNAFQTVLDVSGGTGLCHPLLQHQIGTTGNIIGIDAAEQMLQVAADRVAESRLRRTMPAVAAQRTPPASPGQQSQPSTRRSTTQHADRTR